MGWPCGKGLLQEFGKETACKQNKCPLEEIHKEREVGCQWELSRKISGLWAPEWGSGVQQASTVTEWWTPKVNPNELSLPFGARCVSSRIVVPVSYDHTAPSNPLIPFCTPKDVKLPYVIVWLEVHSKIPSYSIYTSSIYVVKTSLLFIYQGQQTNDRAKITQGVVPKSLHSDCPAHHTQVANISQVTPQAHFLAGSGQTFIWNVTRNHASFLHLQGLFYISYCKLFL